MAEQTKIEWTDATWNIITGCSVVSPGCTNCYAMRLAGTRLRNHHSRVGLTTPSKAGPVWNGEVRFNEQWLHQPLQWTRPAMIFVCAHGDLFHENVPDEWIDKVFAVMALCPQHTFQVLTKRADRMRAYMEERWQGTPAQTILDVQVPAGGETGRQSQVADACQPVIDQFNLADPSNDAHWTKDEKSKCMQWEWPLQNVWLGFSAEDQKRFDERWEHIRRLAAAGWLTWLSGEPLLGPIDITAALWNFAPCPDCPSPDPEKGISAHCCREPELVDGLRWVVVGGESGPGARPMHPDWARRIRDDCAAANVPFLFKQFGDWKPVDEADVPESFHDPACEKFRCMCNNGFIGDLAIGSALQHKPATHPQCFPNGPDEDAICNSTFVHRVGKKKAGRLLDGVIHDGFPEVAA